MENSFSERLSAFYLIFADFFHTNYSYLVAVVIGTGTVLFTILINHGVRLRRNKLIHGFTKTFNPERRRRPSDQALGKDPNPTSGKQFVGKIAAGPRPETDIRYSPSLEFVVSKYITDLDEALTPNEFERLSQFVKSDEQFTQNKGSSIKDRSSNSPLEYMLHGISCFSLPVNRRMMFNALPTIVAVSVGWYIILEALRVLAPRYWIHPVNYEASATKECFSNLLPLAIVFFSSYVASIKILVRAVSLFDLTAITFLRVFLQIIGSMLAGYVIWAVLSGGLSCDTKSSYLTYPLFFMIGFVPDGGINTLLSHVSIAAQKPKPKPRIDFLGNLSAIVSTITQFIKQTDGRFAGITKSTPLDVIDGIDFFTKYRLEEAGIYEVQNLATANPILLHVETPFGIYQVIDWVGQAQLCTVVGLERFLIFRQFNIRTVFDLERAVLSLKATSQIRRMIGGILLMPTNVLTDIGELSEKMGRFPDFTAAGHSITPLDAKTLNANGEKQADKASPPDEPALLNKQSQTILGNAGRQQTQPGYLTALEYCRWAASEALKPSSYRLTLPEKRTQQNTTNEDCGQPYRVFPIDLPKNLVPYAKFEFVDGCKHEVLDIFDVRDEENASIKHAVRLIMDDLHVMRLRQIWESIARILGTDAATLDDSEDTFLGA